MAKKHPNDGRREFTPEVYRAAAEERLDTLEFLFMNGFYSVGLYTAGVAVESIFRAYRCKIDPVFDSRHNLYELSKAARFSAIVSSALIDGYDRALLDIATRWSNNHRYRSDAAMRGFLRRMHLNRGVKGDFLKYNARSAIDAAFVIVHIGLKKWQN
ncbi:MAG TPA: hypothetical protein VFE47_02475 [Tepidisphaeraceae bacterium]|nr:hypothetical protein [Tepidisphaeraceae bacterium]